MDRCPCCRCQTEEHEDCYIVEVGMHKWPIMCIFAGLTSIFADLHGLRVQEAIFFSLLSIIPLFFSLSTKINCINCGETLKSLHKTQ